ncbi:MAG: hypothetical protein VB055_02010 [Oscillospiraceae bacterium]|nr:hypothetical protein [Oscillospiraceae bacterium]
MRRYSIIPICILMCFFLFACGKETANKTETQNSSEQGTSAAAEISSQSADATESSAPLELASLSDFVGAVKALGVSFTEETTEYTLVGAEDGCKLTAEENVAMLELYVFDTGTDAYQAAETSGQLHIEEMDDSFDAVVANGYAIVMDDSFPQREEIYPLFYSLQAE